MKSCMRCLVAACLLLFIAFPAFSQSRNTGEIRGTVTDPSGAAVAGATVTLTNIDTGVTSVYTTNADGLYDTVSTQAGNYNITFTAQGFKKLVRGPFTLQIDVITEDGALEVGTQAETVTVEAQGVPLLETETGHLGTIFEAKTIGVLPQVGAGITGNDWANFNILLPGAQGTPMAAGSEGSGSYNAGDAIAINGNLPNYANYLQDGAVVQLPVSNNVDNLVFEAVQEVQITTSSFSAEYGIGGAVFNQISKAGSNGFHGSAYEFWQNDALNAAPYFQNPGTPVGASFLRYNEWGGSIGGPIIKNKLFFFFVRDKIVDENAPATPSAVTVPTLKERGLDPSEMGVYDFSGTPTIYNPASAGVNGTRAAFAGNIIPVGMIDPVAAKILSFYPLPNQPGQATNPLFPNDITGNFLIQQATPNPNLRYFGRMDYDLSEKNRMSFSISEKNNNAKSDGQLPCPLNCQAQDIDGVNIQFSDTWTISPNLVNEFRMGYTKQGNFFEPDTLGFDPQTTLGLQYGKADVFPTINVNGGSCCTQLAPGINAIYIENLYDPSDVLTFVKGRHVLHFGVEVLMGQGNTTPWGNIDAGQFTFTGQYTAQNSGSGAVANTGSGLADFLLGDVQHWQATNQAKSYARLKSPQLFIQDDFKLRPNLTINLGLRYVATTGFSEINNAIGGFNPNLVNPYNGSLGYVWFAGQEDRTTSQKPIYDIFLPRVGFAWSPRTDTVVRGGFGMYTYNYSQDTYGTGIGFGSPFTSTGGNTDANNGTGPAPLVNLDATAAAAAPALQYVQGSPAANQPGTYCCDPLNPQSVSYVPYNVRPGRINQWQVSVEHQIGQSMVATLAYVGSHGSNLQFPTNANQITDPAFLAITPNQQYRPYPLFNNLNGSTYNAISNYNALQASFTKKYTNGLLFSANFVWSHFLDDQDSSGWGSRAGDQIWQIGNNPSLNYANSNFNIPLAWKGYAAYDLPFGQGKRFMSQDSKLVNAAVGGWRVSGTMITQSGNPYTITDTNGNGANSDCNGCSWYDDRIGNPRAGIPAGPTAGTFYELNPAAFVSPAPGTFGNNGRNSLSGPRLTVFNMSIAKGFSITERVHLELRSDWVNVFNHPSFGPPNSTFGTSGFGLLSSAAPNGGITVAPRSGQLSARISF